MSNISQLTRLLVLFTFSEELPTGEITSLKRINFTNYQINITIQLSSVYLKKKEVSIIKTFYYKMKECVEISKLTKYTNKIRMILIISI